MAHCLTILEVMKWFLFLGEEGDVYRLVVVKRREETRTFSLVVINANVLFFFSLQRYIATSQKTDSTLKASSITNHLQSQAQNIKPNSITGSVGQISEATHRIRSYSTGIRVSEI